MLVAPPVEAEDCGGCCMAPAPVAKANPKSHAAASLAATHVQSFFKAVPLSRQILFNYCWVLSLFSAPNFASERFSPLKTSTR